MIVPLVSLHDQIRSDRYGIALIELLKTVGLLVKETNIYNTTKVMNQELSDNWKEQYIFMFGWIEFGNKDHSTTN